MPEYTDESIQQRFAKRDRFILGHEELKTFAVLLPLWEKKGKTHVLFEVRSRSLKHKPGEICFPGGRVEPGDTDEKRTAIRETCEELAVREDDVSVLAALDYWVGPFQSVIYPFVGRIDDQAELHPNPGEVAEIFTVPLEFFQTTEPQCHKVMLRAEPEEGFPLHLIPGGKQYSWRKVNIPQYFYCYDGRVIWGLTARIMKHFIDTLNES